MKTILKLKYKLKLTLMYDNEYIIIYYHTVLIIKEIVRNLNEKLLWYVLHE